MPKTTLAVTTLLAGLLLACGGEAEDGRPAAARPGFAEVAEKAGLDFRMRFLASEQGETFKINLYDHGSGVCVADYDGDGLDDLYFLNQLGPNGLFRNNGNGTFTDVTDATGVGLGDRICTSAAFADYDNDGDQDLYVSSVRGGNVLFRNDGGKAFVDVSEASGTGYVGHTQGVTWLDFDNDGLLDLYLTNTAKWTLEPEDPTGLYHFGREDLLTLVRSPREMNTLYRNRGDGTFHAVEREVGVEGMGWGGDVGWFDYDDDGDHDLFVTNMFGVSQLYRNDGGIFTDMTSDALGATSWGAVGCKVTDVDGDGRQDLFVIDMHSDMWMSLDLDPSTIPDTKKYSGPEGPMVEWGLVTAEQRDEYWQTLRLNRRSITSVVFGTTLYRNLGGGKFEEISDRAGVETLWPWGIAAADYDQDGDVDAFIPSGMGYPYFPWPSAYLVNDGTGKFARGEAEAGLYPRPGGPWLPNDIAGKHAAKSSRSAAVLDYDGDGRLDIAVNNFNERPYLYRNEYPLRRWIGFRLLGTRSNRDSVGAVVRIHVGDRVQVREVFNAGGYLAQDSKTLYFGLGDAEKVDRVEIRWPSGATETLSDLPTNRIHEAVEPAGGLK